MSYTLEDAQSDVDEIFGVGHGRCGMMSRSRIQPGRELIPATLFQFQMLTGRGEPVSLQTYHGIDARGIGGDLWHQEIRTLRCITALHDPALAKMLEGDNLESRNLAYAATQGSDQTLADPSAMAFMAARDIEDGDQIAVRRLLAFDQLIRLVGGLRRLHARGILHRTLSPASVDVVFMDADDPNTLVLRLARFEMGTLVTNVWRRMSPDRAVELYRRYLAGSDLRLLQYLPPERLAWASDDSAEIVEDGRSDVYTLGAIALDWFAGGAADLSDVATSDLLTEHGAQELTRRRVAALRSPAVRATVPAELLDVLTEMLEPEREKRCTAWMAWKKLTERQPVVEAAWQWRDRSTETPLLVSVAPEHFKETFYDNEDERVLSHPPTANSDVGRAELAAYIESDLRNASLWYEPDGFAACDTKGTEQAKFKLAKYVLIGSAWLYFAAPYRINPLKPAFNEILHLRYVYRRTRTRAGQLLKTAKRIPVPPVEVQFIPLAAEVAQGRTSWQTLMGRSERLARSQADARTRKYDLVLSWLVDVAAEQLNLRQYAFTREVETSTSQGIVLRPNLLSDQRRFDRGLARELNQVRPRPDMVDFCIGLREQKQEVYESDLLRLWPHRGDDRAFAPRRSRVAEATVVRVVNSVGDAVRVEVVEGEVPAKGWLEPKGDEGGRESWRRQYAALEEFLENGELLAQLDVPAVLSAESSQWAAAGDGLKGEAPRVIERMLSSWPFFAVHGPPGTGKTTVTARAIAAMLANDRSHRILVTAQSHDSLDNMAERILATLGRIERSIDAIRVSTKGSSGRVAKSMERYLTEQQTSDTIARIRGRSLVDLTRGANPALIALANKWREEVEQSGVDLSERIRRGANLVFCTCGAATEQNLGVSGDTSVFDWVIVEEAARAWLTELAIPLVRGGRWTLIGDHFQLPAFGRDDVERLLELCKSSADDDLRARTEDSKPFVEVFDFFSRLFEKSEEPGIAVHDPCATLETQFRMVTPLYQLVSASFYNDKLHDSGIVDRAPAIVGQRHIEKQALVWFNTAGLGYDEQEPAWKNPAEADALRTLLLECDPRPDAPRPTLAVLSPYTQQVRLLRDKLRGSRWSDAVVSTVDGFQGKEADAVFISLVRQNSGRAIGYLDDPNRINVMCSRARHHLVLVGNFGHFENCGVDLWQRVCRNIRQYGRVIDASDWR